MIQDTIFQLKVGFNGTVPIAQPAVALPAAIVTTETSDGTYSSNEQSMLTHLKTDVTNLESKLTTVTQALKDYGLFG